MARLKLAPNTELSDVGLALYELAEDALAGGPNRPALEHAVKTKFDNPPKINFVYDTDAEIYIAVPDLSVFKPGTTGTAGQAKFGNEALGFVVMFGCGP